MTLYKINPGKYRHVVIFQKQTTIRNPYGEKENVWTDYYKTRAGIYPISGKEIFSRDFVESEITTRVHIRYNPTVEITSDMRIIYGDKIFYIESAPINFQERNDELQLLCKQDENERYAPIRYADPPTPLSLALTRIDVGTFRLTWELDGETPLNFLRFLIIVNDVETITVTDPKARSFDLTGMNESVSFYVYMATVTETASYYSQAVEYMP